METYTWNVGESIPINIFVADPNDGAALTGQSSFITLTIFRLSDSRYWDGSNWGVAATNLSVAEVSNTVDPGLYSYTLTAAGNYLADRYLVHVSISNPPTIVADAYELHVSRNLNLKVYESEAV